MSPHLAAAGRVGRAGPPPRRGYVGAGNQGRENIPLRANRSKGQERKPGAWSCFEVTVTLPVLSMIRFFFTPSKGEASFVIPP